jgi:hypothetical protein
MLGSRFGGVFMGRPKGSKNKIRSEDKAADKIVDLYTLTVVPRFAEIARWARNGVSGREVAKRLGVKSHTFFGWKDRHPELKEMWDQAVIQTAYSVECSFYRRAVGYDYTEVKTVEDAKGGSSTTTMVRHMPADVMAGMFWLKNCAGDFWKDKRELDTTVRTPQTLADVISSRRDRVLQSDN